MFVLGAVYLVEGLIVQKPDLDSIVTNLETVRCLAYPVFGRSRLVREDVEVDGLDPCDS
jgi:hypothetical protein